MVEENGRTLRIFEQEYARHGTAEPRLLFDLGQAHAEQGNIPRAVELLTEYVRVVPRDDERYLAQIRIADYYRAEAKFPEAIDADLQALKINPLWPNAYFGLARSYYFLREWPKVIHWSDVGRTLPAPDPGLFPNPRDYELDWIIYYTGALFQIGDERSALTWSRHALEIVPDHPMHRLNAALYASMVGPDELIPIDISVPSLPTYAVIPVRDRHELTLALLDQLGLPPDRVIVLDNDSRVPAREALGGVARIVEHGVRNLSQIWNLGLDLVAAECPGPHNVAVLNNDLEVPSGFLDGLAAGLRVRPDHLIAYPDEQGHLQPGVCHASGRMTGFAFMLRGEAGLRADPQFAWWYGDDDLAYQARTRGKVVRVGGVGVRHLAPNAATVADPELAAITVGDRTRFAAKWG